MVMGADILYFYSIPEETLNSLLIGEKGYIFYLLPDESTRAKFIMKNREIFTFIENNIKIKNPYFNYSPGDRIIKIVYIVSIRIAFLIKSLPVILFCIAIAVAEGNKRWHETTAELIFTSPVRFMMAKRIILFLILIICGYISVPVSINPLLIILLMISLLFFAIYIIIAHWPYKL